MVDEFSAFARMPQPVVKPANVNDICRQAVFLQSSAHSAVKFDLQLPPEKWQVPCDSRQISQALTNLLQNAVDAIDGRMAANQDPVATAGHVTVRLTGDDQRVGIVVEDNGKGLPTDVEPDRLMEPYVTTRAKGTGLGLAIVRKIMEDHGGELLLESRAEGGARVSLIIPRTPDTQPPAVHPAEPPSQQPKQTAHGA